MPATQTTTLTPEQLEAFGAELDALRQRTLADLGQRDVDYIRRIIKLQRGLEASGRGLLFFGFLPPAWLGGVATLSLSKILDNMEIGHNVMHGQYDWTGDPALASKDFEWDTACPAEQWRHSHNFQHHTFTNIVGKDRDVGYGILRMDESQPWSKKDLANPVAAVALATLFEYGVALHDLEVENIVTGRRSWADTKELRGQIANKVGKQALKDYVLFPALSGPGFLFTLAGNATANLARNLWSFSIIFCGHFPEEVETFTEEECEGEGRGHWYRRQLLGSANIKGGKAFHVLSGNLSHQIEHHLFPDIPAHRYGEMSGEVREICERYGLPYNTGRFSRQLFSVAHKIVRLALPPKRTEATTPPAEESAPIPALAAA